MFRGDAEHAKPHASSSERFARASIEELIATLNREVANPGWGTASADYLHARHDAFLGCGYDCSSFIEQELATISFRHRVALEADKSAQGRWG